MFYCVASYFRMLEDNMSLTGFKNQRKNIVDNRELKHLIELIKSDFNDLFRKVVMSHVSQVWLMLVMSNCSFQSYASIWSGLSGPDAFLNDIFELYYTYS